MRTPSSHRSCGCERREYAFNVLPEYLIIFLRALILYNCHLIVNIIEILTLEEEKKFKSTMRIPYFKKIKSTAPIIDTFYLFKNISQQIKKMTN